MSDLVERIKQTATAWDAAAVCGFQIPMRAGVKFRVPWREDRSPSASLTADGQRVIDWSTGDNEDAAGIVGRMTGAGFHLAMNLLGVHLGLGEPFPDAQGMGRSRLILVGLADYAEPERPKPEAAVEAESIANFTTVTDAAAHEWIMSTCKHLAEDVETAVAVAEWRGLPVRLVQRLARDGRLGSDGRKVWMPCKQEGGLWVRAQVRVIGPRFKGCEYFWPHDSEHKPGFWSAVEAGRRVVVAEGWGDAAAALAVLDGEPVTIVATLGTSVRKLEGLSVESVLLLRQNDEGDANTRWARSIRALWPSISVKSLPSPAGQKDWNAALIKHGVTVTRQLLTDAMTVPDDELVAMSAEMAGRRFTSLNESMASEVFIELASGDLKHDDASDGGDWFTWTGTHWRPGAEKRAMETAKLVQLQLRDEARSMTTRRPARGDGEEDRRRRAPNELLEAFAAGMGQGRAMKSFMHIASSDPKIAARFAEVQHDPLLLPCQNGIFDLRAVGGGFRPARREDMITRRIGVAFDDMAECPTWLRVIGDIFEGDSEHIAFLQRWFGYTLTGYVHEQKLLFLYGTGSNGKSTVCEILKELLGELGISVPQTMVVMDHKGNNVPDHEVIRLSGTRLILAPEIDKDAKLNEALVKSLTGGDTLRGRKHYELSTDFLPTHKLTFFGNHKPIVRGGDDGVWRRFILLHLRHKFSDATKDPTIKARLSMELAGILNWAIVGCWQWQKDGLKIPVSVTEELMDYRESSDVLGTFLGERVQPMIGMTIMLKDLRSKLVEWAKEAGESWLAENLSIQRLRRELDDRGWKVLKDRNKMPYVQATWQDKGTTEKGDGES